MQRLSYLLLLLLALLSQLLLACNYYGIYGPISPLGHVTIPPDVLILPDQLFYGCTALTSVNVSPNLKEIGKWAFRESGLSGTFNIPASVDLIGEYAFAGAKSLSHVRFDTNTQLRQLRTCTFAYSGLVDIIIPRSVRTIGDQAFESALKLTQLTFQQFSLCTHIGEAAFAGTTRLARVVVGDSNIDRLTFPNTIKYIGPRAFENTVSLKYPLEFQSEFLPTGQPTGQPSSSPTSQPSNSRPRITMPTGQPTASPTGQPTREPTKSGRPPVAPTVQPTYLFVPHLLTIEKRAFSGSAVEGLIKFPARLSYLGDGAFFGALHITNVKFEEPSRLTAINPHTFYESSIVKIYIPDSVRSIGALAFNGCTMLDTVVFGNRPSITSIGPSAFYGNIRLNEIDLPSSVRSIASYAFFNCAILNTVKLSCSPYTLRIESNAFVDCPKLTSLSLPSTAVYGGGALLPGWSMKPCTTFSPTARPSAVPTPAPSWPLVEKTGLPPMTGVIILGSFAGAGILLSLVTWWWQLRVY